MSGSHSDEEHSEGLTLRSRVPAWADRMSLVDYLARRFPYLTAQDWAEEVRQGRISLGDAPITPTTQVRRGNALAWIRAFFSGVELPEGND